MNNGNIKIQKHLQKKKCIPLKIHAFYHSISLKLVTKKSNLSNKQLLNLTDSRFLKKIHKQTLHEQYGKTQGMLS